MYQVDVQSGEVAIVVVDELEFIFIWFYLQYFNLRCRSFIGQKVYSVSCFQSSNILFYLAINCIRTRSGWKKRTMEYQLTAKSNLLL